MEELGLKHLNQFQDILSDYKISQSAKDILQDLRLALLMGPTAAGRNTIINELVKRGDYYYIVSDTTRPPKVRNGILETNGVEYFFRSEEDVLHDLQKGEFLEAEIIHNQQVSGISMRELVQAHQAKKVAVTDIDMNATLVLDMKPDTVVFFIIPPALQIWLQRISTRGDLEPAELRRRMATALLHFERVRHDERYTIIVNNEFFDSVQTIDTYMKHGMPTRQQQAAELAIMDTLEKDTRAFLETGI